MQKMRDHFSEFLQKLVSHSIQKLYIGDPSQLPEEKPLLFAEPQIIFPLAGEIPVRFVRNNALYEEKLMPGNALLLRPYSGYEIPEVPGQEMLGISFMEQYIRFIYSSNGKKEYFHADYSVRPITVGIVNILFSTADKMQPAAPYLLMALLEDLRQNIDVITERTMINDPMWTRIREGVMEKYRNRLVREDLAAFVGIHPAKLSRVLLQKLNISVTDYINEYRLQQAVIMLKHTRLSVNEISDLCGFSYTNYFIRLFHQKFGVTPASYRKH